MYVVFTAMHALHRFFIRTISANGFAAASSSAEVLEAAEKMVAVWILAQYQKFQASMLSLLRDADTKLSVATLFAIPVEILQLLTPSHVS